MMAFLRRFATRIHGVLSGWDRLRLKGTLRQLAFPRGMSGFLFGVGVPFKQFKSYAFDASQQVVHATQQLAQLQQRPLQYLSRGNIDKEALARQIAQRDGITTGLIAVFSALEMGSSYDVSSNRDTQRLQLHYRPRKCLHYYHYYFDPIFGFMHTRLQTWFPFTMQICLNGREWLAGQLDHAGIAYQKRDNCFVHIADLERAQQLADLQSRADWPQLLDAIARRTNPVHDQIFAKRPQQYYWSTEQSEWATDILFRNPDDLAQLYPQWVHHGIERLSCKDVLRFLARSEKPTPHFQGEVQASKKVRREGVRLKFWRAQNSLKMYDKQDVLLRVETTLNHVADFKSFHAPEGQPDAKPAWRTMRKGVADLPRRAEVSQAANERLLKSLATVAETTSVATLAEEVCQPTRWQGRSARALNPLAPDDARLLAAIHTGEFLTNGFRNRDLRPLLFGDQDDSPQLRKQQSAKVTRHLRLLRAHGLIKKVNQTHRYLLTEKGATIVAALLAARQADPAKLNLDP